MCYEYSSSSLKNTLFTPGRPKKLVVCAREFEVYRGIECISWPDLVAVPEMIATDHFQSLIETDRRHPNMYLIQSLVFWRSQMLRTVSKMLELLYNKHTSDPRDHIYGIIGPTRARNEERLQINYSKSVRQLFLDVCNTLINVTEAGHHLCSL
jgi:hypothetical protein